MSTNTVVAIMTVLAIIAVTAWVIGEMWSGGDDMP